MVVIQPVGFMKIRRVAVHQRPFRQGWKVFLDKAFRVPILERDRTTFLPNRFDPSDQFSSREPSVQLPLTPLLNAANQSTIVNNPGAVTPVQIKRAEAYINLVKLPKPRLYFSLTSPLFDRESNDADASAEFFRSEKSRAPKGMKRIARSRRLLP